MRPYFKLELDTTPPVISIDVPHAIHLDDRTGTIQVLANEQLDSWQQFYMVDALGKRYDFIFDHQGDNFRGIVSLHGVATGIATIYAQAKDTAWNKSAVVSASFEILPPKVGGAYGVLTVLVRTLTPLGFR